VLLLTKLNIWLEHWNFTKTASQNFGRESRPNLGYFNVEWKTRWCFTKPNVNLTSMINSQFLAQHELHQSHRLSITVSTFNSKPMSKTSHSTDF